MFEFPDDSGVLPQARWIASPNHDARPEGAPLSMIVVHCISLPPGQFGGEAVADLFCNRLDLAAHPSFAELEGLEVSAHFFIDRAGALTQFVDCEHRAWHAGQSYFCGQERCNDFSIGIELEGTERTPYESAQYAVLASLIGALRRRYPTLAAGALVAHSDLAPGRKSDPGPHFDWQRLRRRLADEFGGSTP